MASADDWTYEREHLRLAADEHVHAWLRETARRKPLRDERVATRLARVVAYRRAMLRLAPADDRESWIRAAFAGLCAAEGLPIDLRVWLSDCARARKWIEPTPLPDLSLRDSRFGAHDSMRTGLRATLVQGPTTSLEEMQTAYRAVRAARGWDVAIRPTRAASDRRYQMYQALERALVSGVPIRGRHVNVKAIAERWHAQLCDRTRHRSRSDPPAKFAGVQVCNSDFPVETLRDYLKTAEENEFRALVYIAQQRGAPSVTAAT